MIDRYTTNLVYAMGNRMNSALRIADLFYSIKFDIPPHFNYCIFFQAGNGKVCVLKCIKI